MTGENHQIPKLGTTFTIVGCGQSAANWTPNGYSIGVNDAFKFGRPLDALVVCNRPETFSKDRLEIILNTKPKDFYCHKSNWSEWHPDYKKLRLHTWAGSLHDWSHKDQPHAYSSNTSPLIAITLAYNLGAKEIILWGVDFKSHHMYNEGNPETKREVGVYLQVFEQLKERGVSVYRGTDGSVFDNLITRYENIASNSVNATTGVM